MYNIIVHVIFSLDNTNFKIKVKLP